MIRRGNVISEKNVMLWTVLRVILLHESGKVDEHVVLNVTGGMKNIRQRESTWPPGGVK